LIGHADARFTLRVYARATRDAAAVFRTCCREPGTASTTPLQRTLTKKILPHPV
jgi:hypothetical protein